MVFIFIWAKITTSTWAEFHPPHVGVSSSGFILLVVDFQLLCTRVYAEYQVGVPWWSFQMSVNEGAPIENCFCYQLKFRPDIHPKVSNVAYIQSFTLPHGFHADLHRPHRLHMDPCRFQATLCRSMWNPSDS
jgi:hypothetical protein